MRTLLYSVKREVKKLRNDDAHGSECIEIILVWDDSCEELLAKILPKKFWKRRK
jgi:hypothetical protein